MIAVVSLQISTIIPHYHHENTVCIVTNQNQHECDEECPSDCSLNHPHDDKDKAPDNDCISKTTFVVSEQSIIKHKIHSGEHGFHFVPVLLYLGHLYDTSIRTVYLTKRRYREKSFPCESASVNRINGLRAPPYSIA
jgi:hypothetical protein